MVRRGGFTFIELLFAIVIVAITVLSLPMMTQVTSTNEERGIGSEEAIFKAFVKSIEVTDEKFDDIASKDKSDAQTAQGSLAGYKFFHKYSVEVTNPASFGEDTNNGDIKKIKINIYDSNGNLVTVLYTYKFKI